MLSMDDALRRAVEKLNAEVRNSLTPIFAYSEMLMSTAVESDRKRLAVISSCAENILQSLDTFVHATGSKIDC